MNTHLAFLGCLDEKTHGSIEVNCLSLPLPDGLALRLFAAPQRSGGRSPHQALPPLEWGRTHGCPRRRRATNSKFVEDDRFFDSLSRELVCGGLKRGQRCELRRIGWGKEVLVSPWSIWKNSGARTHALVAPGAREPSALLKALLKAFMPSGKIGSQSGGGAVIVVRKCTLWTSDRGKPFSFLLCGGRGGAKTRERSLFKVGWARREGWVPP